MSIVVPESTLNELADLYRMTLTGNEEAELAYDERLSEAMEEHEIRLNDLDALVRDHQDTLVYQSHKNRQLIG